MQASFNRPRIALTFLSVFAGMAMASSVYGKLLLPVLLFLAAIPAGSSQAAGPNGKVAEIPIRLAGPIVLVPARVNDSSELWFELDTGFQNSVIDPQWVKPLGLAEQSKQKVVAPGGVIERSTVTGATLTLKNIKVEDQVFSAIDQSGFTPFFGEHVAGILGYDFLKRFVVEIDYEHKLLRLYDPNTYHYAGRGTKLPIDLSSRQPYVIASIKMGERPPIPGRFEIDTGSMDALALNTPFAKTNHIPGDRKAISVRGRSLGGETTGVLTRVDGVLLGDTEVEFPIAAVVWDDVDRAGQISGEILRRFTVILDYARQEMILEKNPHFQEPFESDMAGMFLVAGTAMDEYKTFLVIAGSPADKAGILPGDVLVSLDGRKANQLTLHEVRSLLKQDGVKRRMTFRRGMRVFHVVLRLRRLV